MRLMVILLLFIFFQTGSVIAQANKCVCNENLKKVIEKTELNYAGFPLKVTTSNRGEYNAMVNALLNKVAGETNAKNCFYLIEQYIHFFRDKHFILSYNNERDFDSSVIAIDTAKISDLTSTQPSLPFVGIWVNPDGSTKIAIILNSDGGYSAVKLDSINDNFPIGFVYFTIKNTSGKFFVKEYNLFLSTAIPAKQNGNLLQIWNHAMWGRIYPKSMNDEEKEVLTTWQNNNNGLVFKKLNEQFTYLKVPTFFNNDNAIQELVAKNDAVIRATKYLIVDLTGNGGGNTGWINFLPYFMTNPIIQQPSYVRVSKDNIPLKLEDIAPYVNNPISEEYKKYFPDDVLNSYKKAYAELPNTKQTFYPIPGVTFPLDSVINQPQKIALLVDDLCGSSTEYFFYLSKQSKKTTTYGVNTIGMMDYEGMSTPTKLPYDKFILTIPIVKSSWTDKHPIDQSGFKPDVLLKMPQDEWIQYVMKDLPTK